ncbi:MAG: tRNA (adenosine(37)-N6)-threonylcarbamoyltransferase complex ATPase subunit type 1 TsaE [Sphingobacterium sp.]
MELILDNIDQLPQAAAWLIEQSEGKKVFIFQAPMGAGKTTLIKAICKILDVRDNTSSPTFSIVNEYLSPNGPVYHFDFYRLKDEQEAFDLGYEEYFYSGKYCLIEWPEKIPNLIPENSMKINIEILGPTRRRICII